MSHIRFLAVLLLTSLVADCLCETSLNTENRSYWDKTKEIASSNAIVIATGVLGLDTFYLILWVLGFRASGILAGSLAAMCHSLAVTIGFGMSIISLAQSAGAKGMSWKLLAVLGVTIYLGRWYYFGGM